MSSRKNNSWPRRPAVLGSLTLLFACGACVDKKVDGVSTEVLVAKGAQARLEPGESVTLAFQAVSAERDGVVDEAIEVLITDTSRLTFRDSPSINRIVGTTEDELMVNGTLLVGAFAVELFVPEGAKAGSVTVIASLEGDRGAAPKTQWQVFEIAPSAVQIDAGEGEASNAGSNSDVGSTSADRDTVEVDGGIDSADASGAEGGAGSL